MNYVLLVVAAMLVAATALIYIQRFRKTEGFDGTVPAAAQTSSIPADVGGATSSNPQLALAAPKDVQAASDALNTFKLLIAQKDAATTDLSPDMIKKIQQMQSTIPALETQLNSALTNPDLTGMTVTKATELRTSLSSLTRQLAAKTTGPISTAPAQNMPQPTLIATPPSKITVQDLIHLRDRINEESLKLSNLRSSSPTMLARIHQLEELAGDLSDRITRIQSGVLAITDIPMTKDDADNFLANLKGTGPLPSLHLPAGTSNTTAHPVNNTVSEQLPGLQNPQLQKMLQNAQYLKWGLSLDISYDPELAAQDRVVQRLEAIEARLTQLATSETPLPDKVADAFIKELTVLQDLIQSRKQPTHDPLARISYEDDEDEDEDEDEEDDTPDVRSKRLTRRVGRGGPFHGQGRPGRPDVPSEETLSVAQGKGMGTTRRTFPNGELSPDVRIRPGVAMDSESIKHRGSASAFDDSSVSGPDWQKRSLDLCKQINGASLGDTKNFGCIKNPSEVGPDYSWKGNYDMVCNRLGDTWGGWYPAMFGCPPYDPTAKFKTT